MTDTPELREIATPVGPAAARLLDSRGSASGLLVLGHGAGGGTGAPDLVVAAAAGRDLGLAVALVEQPWRLAGRRVAEPAHRLDAAWLAVVAELRAQVPAGPLVTGGRSTGARVACRTADELGVDAVLALAFPLVAPSGRSRLPELLAPRAPRLVVQGARDPFGVPQPSPGVEVRVVEGADHSFRTRRADSRSTAEALREVRQAVRDGLAGLLRLPAQVET